MTTTTRDGDVATARPDGREFVFERRHFDLLRRLAREEAGIELNDTKTELIYGRLARRLRALHLNSFDEYCALVAAPGASERANFVNAITTNFTSFFREDHHFEFLASEGLPRLMQERSSARRLRIWSAACSTGQEPYSIAITAADAIPSEQAWDWRILATDIDSNAVARAEAGRYRVEELAALPKGDARRRWFGPVGPAADGTVQVDAALRKSIYFRVLNLMDPWPMRGPIDVIFCRNVVIYFSKETQRVLFDRFAELLAPDGYLFIGHSESMVSGSDRFEPVGRTIYRVAGS